MQRGQSTWPCSTSISSVGVSGLGGCDRWEGQDCWRCTCGHPVLPTVIKSLIGSVWKGSGYAGSRARIADQSQRERAPACGQHQGNSGATHRAAHTAAMKPSLGAGPCQGQPSDPLPSSCAHRPSFPPSVSFLSLGSVS